LERPLYVGCLQVDYTVPANLAEDLPIPHTDDTAYTTVSIWKLDRYMAVDPASGKDRKVEESKARQAIVVIGVDHLQRIFTLLAWAGRLPTSRFMDKIIETCDFYKPRVCGIEANAMQSLFVDSVALEARNRMKRLPITPVKQPTDIKKEFRIRTSLEPVINFGRLFVDPSQTDLTYELRGFPTARWMDLVDCLATVISLIPPQLAERQQDSERKELAQYLRRSGMPAHMIERRLNELGGKVEWSSTRRPF